MIMDRLADFGHAKQEAVKEGTAFEQADKLEKGGVPPTSQPAPAVSMEEEAMQMPNFYTQVEEITGNTRRIEEYTGELERLHKQALNTATAEESSHVSAEIDAFTGRINSYSNKNRTLLKNMEVENEQLKDIAPRGSGHMRMRLDKHRQLVSSFLNATKRLQKLQQYYRERYRQQLERQYKIVNPGATAEEIAKVTSDESGAQAKIFASAVREDAKKTLAQMKDRFADVKLIEKSILELHQLFLDLQTMVVQQGDVINKVEYNVDKIDEYNEGAAQDMKLAVEYQKSIWKKKWIITVIICVAIFIVFCIVIYLLSPLLNMFGGGRYRMW